MITPGKLSDEMLNISSNENLNMNKTGDMIVDILWNSKKFNNSIENNKEINDFENDDGVVIRNQPGRGSFQQSEINFQSNFINNKSMFYHFNLNNKV